MSRRCLVLGASGFIASHLVKRLKADGAWVRAVDIVEPPFAPSAADEFVRADLRFLPAAVAAMTKEGRPVDCVYQFATAMGGAGYIFTGANDATVMHTAAQINLNVADAARQVGVGRVFFPSSACVYPERRQVVTEATPLREEEVLPADPDSEYGWEKLFAERLYLAYQRNHRLPCTIARFTSIVGPEGTWTGGKEKVFAAMCRKVAETPSGGVIPMWGDGEQTRTYLYVDECVEGIERLVAAEANEPVNLGSEELLSVNDLAERIMCFAGKHVHIDHQPGPLGVRGRLPDLARLEKWTGWRPTGSVDEAIAKTYPWVAAQVAAAKAGAGA